ncbi:MAG: hypothetical protein JKY56_19490, partial [Kofleriaceae bacterium]|nr:hypothetical protein [Kofleriaceae bacterium]
MTGICTTATALVMAACLGSCGIAERPMQAGQGDGGGGVDGDGGVGVGDCTPHRIDSTVHAASGDASGLFAVAISVSQQLVQVDLSNYSTTDIASLNTPPPERSGLLADEGMIYFSDSLSGTDMLRIDPATGARVVIAQQQVRPTSIVSNSSSIYWGVMGGIMRYEKNTNFVTRIHSIDPTERVDWLAADDNRIVYTADNTSYSLMLSNGDVVGSEVELVQTTRPFGIHGGRFYYLIPDSLSGSGQDEITSIAIDGGTPQQEFKADLIDSP